MKASNTYPKETQDKGGNPTHVTLEMYTDQPHVFQLLFSNKTTSRAIKNLAAFVRDVTHSPAALENQSKKKSYVNDDPLTIYNISAQGKTTDITKETLDNFTVEEWKDWEERLSRSSIKERMDNVTIAYKKIIEATKNPQATLTKEQE